MKRTSEIHVSHLLDIRSVVIHDKQLKVRKCEAVIGSKSVPAGREHDLPTGQGAWSQIEDSVSQIIGPRRISPQRVVGPSDDAGVRRPFLKGQSNDFSRLQMDLENIGAAARRVASLVIERLAPGVIKLCIEHPFAVKRDIRIDHGPMVAGNQDLLSAVRVKQHQIRSGRRLNRILDLGQTNPDIVTHPRSTHVNDVVFHGATVAKCH